MATKAKAKARKPAAKKPRKRAAKKKTAPAHSVANHRFEPGSEVGFYPRSTIEVEKGMSREPIPEPTKTAKVSADGALEVRGLDAGLWTAVAQVAGRWRFFDFSVS